jgi:DNA-binding XRE family transcriptional regulator
MNQRQLAARLGVRPSHVNHILWGRRTPSLKLAMKIAELANCPIESLLDRVS